MWRSGAPQRRGARGARFERRCTYALLYAVAPSHCPFRRWDSRVGLDEKQYHDLEMIRSASTLILHQNRFAVACRVNYIEL
jgi:hypothetical protein